jgi:hypothetical protein
VKGGEGRRWGYEKRSYRRESTAVKGDMSKYLNAKAASYILYLHLYRMYTKYLMQIQNKSI